jgi:hypothetical protein
MSPRAATTRLSLALACVLLLGATTPAAIIRGTPTADRLGGTNGADRIDAGAGNDTVFAGDGNDLVRGGPGRDGIELGPGNDTVLLAPGDGQDQLIGADVAVGKRDTVQFAKGIVPSQVSLYRQPRYALVIQYGRSDKLVIPRHFENDGAAGFGIDAIRFANGQGWNAEAIRREVLRARPTAQYLVGYGASESIDGGGGNDLMYGGFGNDTVAGGAGNDRIFGDEGNDTLWGGPGNDLMRGEKGNDTYLYRGGDGLDSIQNFSNEGEIDVVRFVNHVKGAVTIRTKGTDLLLTVNDDPKQGIRIIGFNGSATWPLSRIEYREGKPTTVAELQALYPKVAQRLGSRKKPAATASVRPKREPALPRATHRIQTPLEALQSPAPPAQDAHP